MSKNTSNTGLKFMIACTFLLAFLLIFIFLNNNTASASEMLTLIPA